MRPNIIASGVDFATQILKQRKKVVYDLSLYSPYVCVAARVCVCCNSVMHVCVCTAIHSVSTVGVVNEWKSFALNNQRKCFKNILKFIGHGGNCFIKIWRNLFSSLLLLPCFMAVVICGFCSFFLLLILWFRCFFIVRVLLLCAKN